jgi:hypothetical protein
MQADGSYIGCYCHYDGYPSGVGLNLLMMNPEDIKTMVTAGIIKGGIRSIYGSDLAGVEYFDETWPEARRTQLPGGEEYDYMLETEEKLAEEEALSHALIAQIAEGDVFR